MIWEFEVLTNSQILFACTSIARTGYMRAWPHVHTYIAIILYVYIYTYLPLP